MHHPSLFRFFNRLRQPALACAAAATLTAAAHAAVSWKDIQFGGFLSQGYIAADGNNYPFEDTDGTFDFREMAFNASTTLGAHLRVGGQLFAERLGNYGEDQVRLDWAVADYNFRPEFGLRAGRIKYPKGLYGEALDLESIRPFVFLPMAVYNPVLRDFSAAFNGGMAYGSISAGRAGSFDYKVFYGDIPMSSDQGVADYFTSGGTFAGGRLARIGTDYVAGASLDWNTPVNGLKIHADYSFLDALSASGALAAYPVLPVTIGLRRVAYTTIGAEYLLDRWTFAAEWQGAHSATEVTAPPLVHSQGDYGVDSGYLSVARRVGDKWEIGTYFAMAKNRHPTAGTTSAANRNNDLALAVRYDVSEHVALKLEGHYVDGFYNMMNTAKTPNPSFESQTTFVAVKTTVSF